MKKNDLILIGVILLAAGVLFCMYEFLWKKDGAVMTVTVDGEKDGTYPLYKNTEVIIKGKKDGTNIFEIKDGKASMIEANCPDKLCVHQKSISKTGDTIVCLPHKVVLEVTGAEENDVDAVSSIFRRQR